MTDRLFDNITGDLVDELKQRGVKFPLHGFAPGLYNGPCRSCARRFMGDKGSRICLPCALAKSIAASNDVEAAREAGERAGYRLAIADLMERGRQRYGEPERIVVETVNNAPGAGPVGRA